MPRTTPSSGAAGVVSTFPEKKPFGVSRTTSVKVPPISTASRQPFVICSEFQSLWQRQSNYFVFFVFYRLKHLKPFVFPVGGLSYYLSVLISVSDIDSV